MSTRSLTIIQSKEEEIVVMYRQMDGYPKGHGLDLAEFLSGMVIVNGIGSATPAKAANGVGCLAAQVVAHFKNDIGNIYLYPAGARNYRYYIEVNKSIYLKIYSAHWNDEIPEKILFEGTPEEVKNWIEKGGENVEE